MTRLLTAALLLATAPAFADPPCLMMRDLYSWHELGKNAVMLEDFRHHRFKVDYTGYCGNLQFALGIGVRSQSTTSLACLRRGDMLLARQNGMDYQCMVQKVEPLNVPPPGPDGK